MGEACPLPTTKMKWKSNSNPTQSSMEKIEATSPTITEEVSFAVA